MIKFIDELVDANEGDVILFYHTRQEQKELRDWIAEYGGDIMMDEGDEIDPAHTDRYFERFDKLMALQNVPVPIQVLMQATFK